MRGLPKKYAKMGFKEGWKAYKKEHSYKKVYKGRKSKTKTVKRVVRRRSYRKRRRRRTRKIPLAPIIGGVAGLFAPTSKNPSGLMEYLKTQNWQAAGNVSCTNLTGFIPQTGEWRPQEAHALHGLVIGAFIHKLCGWLGINRYFGNMPSPLNKLSI